MIDSQPEAGSGVFLQQLFCRNSLSQRTFALSSQIEWQFA
jgi:hypothetical protein